MTEGMKFDNGKLRWSLLPAGTVEEVVKVLDYGAGKYGYNNWQFVEHGQIRYYDATMRHINAWWNGQRLDPETNLHHLAHAICSLMFLMWIDNNTFTEGWQGKEFP